MVQTNEDIRLQHCLSEKQQLFRKLIEKGRPYVWELRLSFEEFNTLEAAVNGSIRAHSNDYRHLICEDYAIVVVIYLAEWYKRYYKGAETMDENKILSLTTEELKQLYELAHIDRRTFVYNASKNPDKTSFRWLESLQILGGLAVQAELKRDKTDPLLPLLCKIFHGEEIALDDLKDRNRAVAFQESIARQHSLYEYLDCILNKEKEPPFAKADMRDETTAIPEFIRRIEMADNLAKKDKFDFEWIVAYNSNNHLMTRHLRVKLKPEVIGGGLKQYIGYDRLRRPEWGIEQPENLGRITFFLRFKCGGRYVKREGLDDDPLFKYDNTGNEKTGFLSINKIDENTYCDVPVDRFDKVEMVMKYDGGARVVQELEVKDYMQVYALPQTSFKFSTRKNPQTLTAVIFPKNYRLAPEYQDLPVAFAHYKNGDRQSEDYCWCPVNDKLILIGPDGKEILPPFFNRNGLYQVVTKKYLATIKYKDNIYVLYKYIDTDDEDDNDTDTEDIPVLFGRSGLEVRHFASGKAKEGELVYDYDLEWRKPNGKYTDWEKEPPAQGKVRLRVTVKGMVFLLTVYYVPFEGEEPVWRDFEHHCIRSNIDGVDDIQDDIREWMEEQQDETIQLIIGNEKEKILVDVYRPVILHELSQFRENEDKPVVLEKGDRNERLYLPLINCGQFAVRDFSEKGVRTFRISNPDRLYYKFPAFNKVGLSTETYLEERMASDITNEMPLKYVHLYVTKASETQTDLYAWNYKEDPVKVANSGELLGDGIVFQSMKENRHPRHYTFPVIKKGKARWGGKKTQTQLDVLYCFITAAEHNTYFFLFEPLVKSVATNKQVGEILLPLIKKRQFELSDSDMENLYRFALHFHFDWMLLPRTLYKEEIRMMAQDEEEQERMKVALADFFGHTPKCTDERERASLHEFLRQYWTFNGYPKLDQTAEKALDLILGKEESLPTKADMTDFLSAYDGHSYKFIEMSKAITNQTEKRQ